MHRFFLPATALSGPEVRTTDRALVHHLRDVLRLAPGDAVILLDNAGWEYQVVLEVVASDGVAGRVQERRLCTGEPRTKVILYQALLKGERFEWALQKGTEIGASVFVPILSERCIVQDATQLSRRKWQRWEKIIQGAAEQSRRGRMPPLQPLMLLAAAFEQVQRSGGLALIAWEEGGTPIRQALDPRPDHEHPFTVHLFIGPEGGFAPAEIRMAQDYGLLPICLGPRILRAETAGVAALAAILYHYGEMA